MLSRLRLVGAHFSLRPPPSRLTLGMVTPYCLGTRHFYSSPQPWRKIVHDQADLPFKQGGLLEIFLPHTTANIKLNTTWAESVKVLMLLDGSDTYIFDDDADQDPRARVIMDTEENKLSITEVQLSSHENLHMHRTLDIIVEIPQVCNVNAHCASGSIRVLPKLEGNLSVSTTGNVTLGVVRGDKMSLTCNGSFLKAKELQAQDLSMECQSCNVKLAICNNMDVVAEGPLKFGSLYSNSSSIKVVEGIAIGTSHGRLNVESDKGSFFVGGVSGSIDGTAFRDITAHIDALGPKSKSSFKSVMGSISISCASDVTAGVYAKGLLSVDTPNWEQEADLTTGREGKIVGKSLGSLSKSEQGTGGINKETARRHRLDRFDSGGGRTEDSIATSTNDEPSLMLDADEGITLQTLNFVQVGKLKAIYMQ